MNHARKRGSGAAAQITQQGKQAGAEAFRTEAFPGPGKPIAPDHGSNQGTHAAPGADGRPGEPVVDGRSGMRPSLGLPQIVALYLGSVIGSGILLIPGLAAEQAGPASILAWLAMSVLVVPMAVTMGWLAARHPGPGGVSHFVRLAYGAPYGNLTGWFFLLSVPLGGPVLAVTGARYLAVLLHWNAEQVYLTAAVIVLLPLLLNVYGLHLAGRLQTVVVAVILGVLVLSVTAAVPHVDTARLTPFMPHGPLSVVQAAGLMFWCFIGWEAVTHLSGEFVDPRRNAVRGILWSAGIVALVYLAVAFTTVATGSYGGENSAASLSLMVQRSLGAAGGWAVAVAALFICLAAHNAYSSAASRTAYALAQEGAAPKWLGALHPRYGTPVGGLLFIAAGSMAALLLLYSEAVSLAELIALPNAAFIATYIGGCMAGVRLLRDGRWGRRCAGLSLAAVLALYPFLGWPALFPAGAAAILFLRKVRRRNANQV
ncbi:amino acid efflux transporter [Paenibacillus mucilaginosus]|uniref:APC family permease n=1 Tax=Paenibacillus mucilaginosus TaxID=61624 RepID=UPI003D25A315